METSRSSFVHSSEFDDPSLEDAILANMPGEAEYLCSAKRVAASKWDDELDALPVLTAEQETHLFRMMNFLKCQANRPDAQPGNLAKAEKVRERLVRANLRLLFNELKRFQSKGVEREELVSEGEIALWRAVEKFDYSRGYRFNTFAIRVIRRRLGGRIKAIQDKVDVTRQIDEFPFDTHPYRDSAEPVASEFAGSDLAPLLRMLPRREKEVVCLRCGLGEDEALSLAEVGAKLGISKTRVRQLELEAYAKLRRSLQPIAC